MTLETQSFKSFSGSPKSSNLPWDLLPNTHELITLADERSDDYQANQPFAHIVLDNFLNTTAARTLANCFPKPEEDFWVRTHISDEIKSASAVESVFPSPIRSVLYGLNSGPMLQFLERLTGISGLIPDPYFNGGGVHQTLPGGKLGVHVDFNQLPQLNLYRRLNLLLYLNENWEEKFGGHLELWDYQGKQCHKKVAPVFNRCVIFTTTSNSYHGHPQPLTCPVGRSRNSLALYYYTALPPEGKKSFVHGTVFMDTSEKRHGFVSIARRWFSLICPPIFLKGIKGCLAQWGLDR
ncbi:MAG: 2OG-Fe(II) oxygenase [Proteobacteria bacterium]|nr:2OG-Fe(II) oxygenase [Pseudomonadota bacterium]NDC23017.1 2OG-Fe(II) oxygenase [Pseudomonadota bacterium]NDD04304.1 2OG-Fe(II) oxygenase [Pseudomonadota bacterium]NDG26683.1 2OG-Fe(II) oxygenase [Pseudomonadota bacterium]